MQDRFYQQILRKLKTRLTAAAATFRWTVGIGSRLSPSQLALLLGFEFHKAAMSVLCALHSATGALWRSTHSDSTVVLVFARFLNDEASLLVRSCNHCVKTPVDHVHLRLVVVALPSGVTFGFPLFKSS